MQSPLLLSPARIINMLILYSLNPNPTSYIHILWKLYLKGNITVIPNINNFVYHLINLVSPSSEASYTHLISPPDDSIVSGVP